MSWMRARANALSVRMRTWWPEQRDRLAALGVDRQRQQADRHLLAGRGDHVQLALVGQVGDLLGQAQQAVGLARHRRDDHHHVVALALRREAAPGDVADALDGADRSSAVFLHDQQGAGTLQHQPAVRQDRRERSLAVEAPQWPSAIEVHITAPDVERAAAMARTLVDEGLCACVNIVQGGAVHLPSTRARSTTSPRCCASPRPGRTCSRGWRRACASCTPTTSRRSWRSRSTKAARLSGLAARVDRLRPAQAAP